MRKIIRSEINKYRIRKGVYKSGDPISSTERKI